MLLNEPIRHEACTRSFSLVVGHAIRIRLSSRRGHYHSRLGVSVVKPGSVSHYLDDKGHYAYGAFVHDYGPHSHYTDHALNGHLIHG